jgi:coatomer protein complex subunit alpha (xenin)
LEQVCQIQENVRIKSGVWSESGVFYYSTLNHFKYALLSGDSGIIRTMDQTVYLSRVKSSTMHCIDRQGNVRVVNFDPTECHFKMALVNRNYNQVFEIIQTSNLVGQSVIGYLQKKGYPEIALQFVQDPKTRFELALQCGDVAIGLEMAKVIDKEQFWLKLGREALQQGNQEVAKSNPDCRTSIPKNKRL